MKRSLSIGDVRATRSATAHFVDSSCELLELLIDVASPLNALHVLRLHQVELVASSIKIDGGHLMTISIDNKVYLYSVKWLSM